MSKGLDGGKGGLWTSGASSYTPSLGIFTGSPEHVAAVAAALIRPGGRTPPVRAFCTHGHSTGVKFRCRLIEGALRIEIEGAVSGSVYNSEDPSASNNEQLSPGWSLYCSICSESGTVRQSDWVKDRVLGTIKRWVDSGRPGPMRFRWT